MPSKLVTISGVMTYEDSPNVPSQGPGFPTNPIAPGGQPPLGIWGGAPPWVSHPIAPGGLPGTPTHPIYFPPVAGQGPGFPTNPIAPGGQPPYPSQGPGFPTNPIAPGGPPNVIWPSPGQPPMVGNPIAGGGYVIGWSPYLGYVLVPIGGAPPAGSGPRPDNTLPDTEPRPDNTLPDTGS